MRSPTGFENISWTALVKKEETGYPIPLNFTALFAFNTGRDLTGQFKFMIS